MPVHKTSAIYPNAQLADNVTIGPYCSIGRNVCIDSGTFLGSNVVIEGWTKLGKNCKIRSGAILGGAPQIVGFKEKPSWVQVGDRTEIREFVTIHRSSHENGITSVGSGAFLMAYVHVAHDCHVGNDTIITNYSGMSGHVTIGEKVVIGGYVGIHQFVRIGKMAMVGGMVKLTKDVLPFAVIEGDPPKIYGINTIGLRRNNIDPSIRSNLKKALKYIGRSKLNTRQALEKIKQEIPNSEEIEYLIQFIKTSERGIHK